jgi:hypothetical protein
MKWMKRRIHAGTEPAVEAGEPAPATVTGQIVLRVPGPWVSMAGLAQALAGAMPGQAAALAGDTLHDRQGALATVALCSAEGEGAEARLTRQDPSFASAERMVRAALALVEAGGQGVIVENSGLAHSAAGWRGLAQGGQPADLYAALVAVVEDEAGCRSSGMHCFGLPDCLCRSGSEAESARRLVNMFDAYLLLETPDLSDGHVFRADEWSPLYRLARRKDRFHALGDLRHNPFGMWELVAR